MPATRIPLLEKRGDRLLFGRRKSERKNDEVRNSGPERQAELVRGLENVNVVSGELAGGLLVGSVLVPSGDDG